MTDLTELRRVAEAAHADWTSREPTWALREYHGASKPATVLALIDRLERAEKTIADALTEVHRIEDRAPHDIDGMVYTIPWAEGVVAGSNKIRRILSSYETTKTEGSERAG